MNIGIIGAGHIAQKMASTINLLDDFTNYAIASRSIKKAESFKKKYGFKKAYNNYEDLLKDEDIDLVYIATPHSFHYEHMKLCLKYHKPVLCEKILTTSSEDTMSIYKKFEEENVFVNEALWTSFLPSRSIINELIENEEVGKIISMNAYFEIPILYKERIVKKELGGGVAMDLGVYPISFILRTLGFDYESIEVTKLKMHNEVDIEETVEIIYKDKSCSCFVSGRKIGSMKVIIYGDEGKIVIDNVTCPNVIKVYPKGAKMRKINCKPQYGGFEYQLRACKKAIEEKRLETKEWTHEDSIRLSKIVDKIIK